MLQQTWQAQMTAQPTSYIRTLGEVNYFSITNESGRLRLMIHNLSSEEPLVTITHQGQCRKVLRSLMALIDTGQVQSECYGEGPISFLLIDPCRLVVQVWRKRAWSGPRDQLHPTQMLLKVSYDDRKATKAVFYAARPDLSNYCAFEALRLPGASQHRFVDCLLEQSDGSWMTTQQALDNARKHAACLP